MAEQPADTTSTEPLANGPQTGEQHNPPQEPIQPETGSQQDNVEDWRAEAEKWKALSRKNEERATSNAEKAKQFDAFQESQKTELQKAQDEANKWKAEFEASQKAALRAETAAKNNIPVELLTGDTQETLDAQVKALLAFKTPTPPNASNVNTQAGSQSPTVFTQAQISDRKFYQEHRDEILKAMSEGRIK